MPDLAAGLSYAGPARLRLDPRTSLLALLVVNVVCLSAGFTGPGFWARAVASLLPLALLVSRRRFVAALGCLAATAVALTLESAGLAGLATLSTAGAARIVGLTLLVLGALANLVARFLPVVLMAWYVMTTIRAGELMGALGRARIPRVVVIPLAVVLRMVPVLAAESAAIGQAARTRGLASLVRPKALIGYRIVPLTLRTVDIGDELTQAGFTRGLEAGGRRTCYGRLGFGWADGLALAVCVAAVVLFVLGL